MTFYFLYLYLLYYSIITIDCYYFGHSTLSRERSKCISINDRRFHLKKFKWRLYSNGNDISSLLPLKLDSKSNYNNLKIIMFQSLNSSGQVPTPFISQFAANLSISASTANTNYTTMLESQQLLASPTSFGINISDDIHYRNDLIDVFGSYEYSNIIQQWASSSRSELCEVKTCIDKIVITTIPFLLTSDNRCKAKAQVNWNVTFIPYSVQSLYNIRLLLPGVTVKFYNLLNKERFITTFSWRTFYQFFGKLLFENQLNLPLAVITGVTEYTFIESESFDIANNYVINNDITNCSSSNPSSRIDLSETKMISSRDMIPIKQSNVPNNENIRDFATSDAEQPPSTITTAAGMAITPIQQSLKLITKWTLLSGNERINLIQSIRNNKLKNRILANHLLEFLDSRKPGTIGVNAWNSIILTQLPGISKIPGMNQFDIDGLDNSFGNSNSISNNNQVEKGQQSTSSNLEKVNQILFYATSLVLFCGVAFSIGMFNRIFFNDGRSF